ncbi:MAG: septal ring lytic transglycosylase RlpA family protein [Terriglobia bacterium]
MIRYALGLGVAAFVAISPPSQAGQRDYLPYCMPSAWRASSQDGVASWYGQDCQGDPTASGEAFDMNGLTAAHPDLPLGTRVKVTNLANHRSLILRVNDRGPNVPGRMLDVSHRAARLLGFSGEGLARVRVQVLRLPRHCRLEMICPGAHRQFVH